MSERTGTRRSGDWSAWRAPRLGAAPAPPAKPPSPAELEAIRKTAHDSAYADGYAAGLAAAEADMGAVRTRLLELLSALEQPLHDVDEQVIGQLLELVTTVARRLVRRELKTDPGQVVAVVREALSMLPLGVRNIRVHLHPQDAQLVNDVLAPAQHDAAWEIVEDPVMTSGGCRISSPSSQIDATVEARLHRVISAMFGSERDSDHGRD